MAAAALVQRPPIKPAFIPVTRFHRLTEPQKQLYREYHAYKHPVHGGQGYIYYFKEGQVVIAGQSFKKAMCDSGANPVLFAFHARCAD